MRGEPNLKRFLVLSTIVPSRKHNLPSAGKTLDEVEMFLADVENGVGRLGL
jgi:hypothetical protein